MARSAEQDRQLYAHSLDASIIAGIVTIVLHFVFAAAGIEVPAVIWTGLGLAVVGFGVGTYFLKRRKDAP